MTEQPTAYDDYLAALRELDAVRADQEAALAARRSQLAGMNTTVDHLRQRLSQQSGRLHELAAGCKLPPPPSQLAPLPRGGPIGDPSQTLTAAAGDVEAADAAYQEARYLAHRATVLPRWRADDRNGLIYGVFALLSLVVQGVVLASAAGTEQFSELFGPFAICLVLPAVAWVAGYITIGVASRPLLGVEAVSADGKLPRNPKLGAVICASTFVIACGLGNVYLNF